MSDVINEVASLISPLKRVDPRLHRALKLLNEQLHKVTVDLEPLLVVSTDLSAGGASTIDAPAASYIFTPRTIRFSWDAVDGGVQYEMRVGSSWDTASFVFRTVNRSADIDPIPIGTYTYLLKTLDIDGNYSPSAASISVTVPLIPAVIVSGLVIDNNILLSWSEPTSVFEISYYEIFKDGVSVGTVDSTFAAFFEPISGTYEFQVVAHDIAENESDDSTLTPFEVRQPPDFELLFQDVSTLGGTKTDVYLEGTNLICSVNTETWAVHFSGHGWTDIQDQVNAGYPLYTQPSKSTGSYQEVVDYGTTIAQSIIAVTWNATQYDLLNLVNVVVKMATSTDNITYSAFSSGSVQFLSSFRYIKYKLEFSNPAGTSLMALSNLTFNLSVKREIDGGSKAALSTDVGGTVVTFTKTFKQVESITATVRGTTGPFVTIIDFTSVPNPTTFKVLVFDAAGTRQSKTIDWKARGIV